MGGLRKRLSLAVVGLLMLADFAYAQSLAYAPWVPLQSAPRRDYDIRFGELFFDVEASLELELNSNVNTSENNAISDFIISPGISAGGSWQYSDLNTLRFGVGLQYRYYLNNPELGSNGSIFDLTPETEIDTIILIGEAYIRLFDRVTVTTDAADTVGIDAETGEQIFDSTDYALFENTLGVQISYDLNVVQTSAQLYRKDVFSFEDDFEFVDRVEYSLSGTVSRRVLSTLTAGLGAGWNTIDYDDPLKGDIDSYNLGVFANAVLTPFITLYGGVNWGTSDIGASLTAPDRSSDSVSYNVTLSHTVNAYFDHSLGFTSVRRLGSLSDFVDVRTLRYDWNLEEALFVDISGYFAWEHGEEEGGTNAETYDRYIASVEAQYALGPRSDLTARLTYTEKDSNRALRSYEQAVFWLRFTYDF